MNKKVLIIEDDRSLADLVSIHLRDLGCRVTVAYDGGEGLNMGLNDSFDLIILDIMLPGTDGLEVCRRIREHRGYVPILMLTAKSEEFDKVLGLELGADDYMTKPFSIRELLARVKAIIRRIESAGSSVNKHNIDKKILIYDTLTIDPVKRKVTNRDERLDLTAKEFDLLYLLASHPGRSFSREQILREIWDYNFSGYEHTVNSHINRLRAKIEPDMAHPHYILTSWGIGYRFVELTELSD